MLLTNEIMMTTTTVTPAEPRLAQFNDSAATYPRNICLHQLFEAQVERTPDAPCLLFQNEILTYRAVNARANQLAHRLRQLGVRPETLVGICMERSPDLVIAMYAVLKAGGAYVPLDPSYPTARLTFMLEDANVPVLLTQTHLQSLISNLQSPIVICVDTEELNQERIANVDSDVREDNLAYVIYTSGSTGQPKGVMIEHRGICNQLQWMQQRYPLTTKDAVLLKTPFSFDLSLYEFFSPLLAGATLVIANPDGHATHLIELIQRARVTTLFMVPSQLQMLLELPDFTACDSLRRIFCSGEALPFALQQRFFATMPPPVTLHNLYGPTEASVECTFWDCERETNRNFVPVGRPIANYQIHILDEQGHPVPIGTPGELHISGIGLARGYWNRAALTAERFLSIADCGLQTADLQTNPKSIIHNPKLYKTGDLARWHADGVIECLGRVDFQVKIRGHRIELGEIEAALASHESVRECVVTAREDVPGDQRLVAYIVPQPSGWPVNGALRAHLQQKLPAYMIPAAFVPMTAFPLSPNGKLDRKQLPAPEAARSTCITEFTAPANDIEHKLKQIWEETLRVHPISVTENFFDLGGHSLLAVRLFTVVEKTFGQKLPLATLFQAPTIRQLAALLAQDRWQPSWQSLVALQSEGDRPPFFCIHAVGGNVLEYYELAQQMRPNQPFYGLQSVGLDGARQPLRTIAAMASQYLSEIRGLQPRGPYYLGGRSFGGVVAYEMAQQLRAAGEEVALVALLDTDPIGWLKCFSRRASLQYQARFLALRIQRHWHNLRELGSREKLNYLHKKADYKKRKLTTLRWQFARLTTSDTTANTLHDVEEFNYQAARQYVPAPYPGRVTFIYAQEEISTPENIFGWETLATGGVEVIAVPGNHQSMIKAPQVHRLAEQLKARLTQTNNHY
jgi:amino acid adenylation domain-containing protein